MLLTMHHRTCVISQLLNSSPNRIGLHSCTQHRNLESGRNAQGRKDMSYRRETPKSKKQQSKRNLCMQMRNKLAFHHTIPSRRIYQIEYSLDYIMWACAMDGPWITCQRPRPLPETDIIDNMSHFYQWSAKFSIQFILNELFMVLITVMTLKLKQRPSWPSPMKPIPTRPNLGTLDIEYHSNTKCVLPLGDFHL